jgi:uncharacterized glyoxalase superfamily protein PhnB
VARLLSSCPVFPCVDVRATAAYYSDVLGFTAVSYLEAREPHVCLYRDDVELILTVADPAEAQPARARHGYGYDAYVITDRPEALQEELAAAGAVIARPLTRTDYRNREFVVEDVDGRWIGFGLKG